MTELINSILDLSQVQALHVDFSRLQKIPRQQAEQRQIILFDRDADKFVHVLTTNNHPEELKNFLAQLTNQGVKYKVFYTSLEGFLHAVTWYDQLEQQQEQELQQLQIQQQAKGQSAITIMKELFQKRATFDPGKFIMELVRLSFQSGASDLHFQPSDTFVVLRLRLDGILHDILQFDIKDFGKYLQKLKFISGVKMNVNSLPQDGRFSFESHTPQGEIKKIDARVSFIPGLLSESTVIRFLDSSRKISTFQDIGFLDREYNILKPYLAKTTGIIIVAGPTGSGKTTTLYTALQTLNTGKTKIITLEDPVEYLMPGIQQSQIDYSKGYDYETGLHAVLRHDPDVILVGETRSQETADISITAALTGHLVFTTLHTNNAIASIERLLSMNVKPYLLAPALQLVVGQRLVRKVCPHCSVKTAASYAADAEIQQTLSALRPFGLKLPEYDGQVLAVNGCEQCNHTGYIGRIAVIELLEITEEIRNLIVNSGTASEIYAKARANGFISMQEDGILKVLSGLTTIDELHRVL